MAEWPSSASRMRSKSSHKVSLRYRCSGVLRADPAHRNASAIASPRMNPRLLRPGTHLGGWGRVSDSGAAICVACWWLAALPASLNPNSLLSWENTGKFINFGLRHVLDFTIDHFRRRFATHQAPGKVEK